MTVTNRRIPRLTRTQIPAPQHFNQTASGENIMNSEDADAYTYVPLPKHIPFPHTPNSSDLFNEFLIFAFTIIASGAQFLHLYRTAFWIPDSNINQTVVCILL